MKSFYALVMSMLFASNALAVDFTVQLSPAANSVGDNEVSSISQSKVSGLGTLASKSSLTSTDIPSILAAKISDFSSAVSNAVSTLSNRVISLDNSGTTYINTSQSFTSNATIPNTIDSVFGDTTAAPFTLTLPDATLNKSKIFEISKINANANFLTVAGSIGSATFKTTVLHSLGETIRLRSNGTFWAWASPSIRTEAVTIKGVAGDFNCTSSVCTLEGNSGNWISATRTATGTYSLIFTSGIFSGQPTCTCFARIGGVTGRAVCGFSGVPGASGMTLETGTTAGVFTDGIAQFSCTGPR